MLRVLQEIDSCIAKASEQGYSAIVTLGSKGISYATNVLVTTAVKVCTTYIMNLILFAVSC